MLSAIISGVIGGLVSIAITSYVAKRVGNAAAPGELRFGLFMWLLGVACLAFALLPAAVTIWTGDNKEFWAKAGLFVGFGAAAIYCLGEAAFVRGSFDGLGLQFSTPWTGVKKESWKDLLSVKFNASCSWYALTFRSGGKVRLSTYLSGHRAALDMAQRQSGLVADGDVNGSV